MAILLRNTAFLFPSACTLGKCPGAHQAQHRLTSPQQRVPCAGEPVQRMRGCKAPRELPARTLFRATYLPADERHP